MNVLHLVDKEELKALNQRSDLWAVWMAFANFALVAFGFALPILWAHWGAWVLASILLGARALGLGVLVHDTAHATLFTSKRLNEWTGKWLFGALPNVPYDAYRTGHLAHHRLAGTEADPDLPFVDGYPATRASLLRKLLRDVSGLNGLKNLAFQVKTFRLASQAPFLVGHAVVLAILWAVGRPEVYACWWLGQLFVFPLVLRLRVMGEHGGVSDHFAEDPRSNTATTLAGPVARLFCAPNFVNFHLEHHFAPSVPSYRLARMHRLLSAKGCYEGWSCIAPSFVSVIKRCALPPGVTGQPRRRAERARGALNNMQ